MKIREDRNDNTKQKPRKIVADALYYRGLRHDSILNTAHIGIESVKLKGSSKNGLNVSWIRKIKLLIGFWCALRGSNPRPTD